MIQNSFPCRRVLIVSPHFYPESFKCNDVAFELARRGYDVTVLSDIPNYPSGVFFKGYGVFRRRREVVNGVKIIRTLVVPRGDGRNSRLALNYLSFAITASLRAIWIGIFGKFDVILVHETSPVTVGIPAVIVKKLQKKSRLLFWVLDLWPESVQAVGGVNNKRVLAALNSLTKLIYAYSDRILVSSMGFFKNICEKGDYSDKMVYFPNWAEDCLMTSDMVSIPELPDGFQIVFAGNIGEAQDFEHILSAMDKISDKRIHLIIVGDGRKREWVEDYAQNHNLTDRVHLVGRYPIEAMRSFFACADVLMFALKDSPIFNLTCPAKVQAYMTAGKPIVAMLNGEGAAIVREADCGMTVPAGDDGGLAEVLEKLATMPRGELNRMGKNARRYYEKHFSFWKNMELLERIIKST